MRFLVVDDEGVNRDVAEVILTSAGHEVVTANDGAEAVALCVEAPDRFDAVLMDILMPVLNGVDATRQLREHDATRHLPIIYVSGSTPPGESDPPGDHFLQKPYRRKELLDALRTTFVARGLMTPEQAAQTLA